MTRFRKWTLEEEALLREMVQAKLPAEEIAFALDRTIGAWQARALLLGLRPGLPPR